MRFILFAIFIAGCSELVGPEHRDEDMIEIRVEHYPVETRKFVPSR